MSDKVTVKKLIKALTDSKALKWMIKNSKSQWFNIFSLTFLNIILAGIAVFNSYMLRNVIDAATGKNKLYI